MTGLALAGGLFLAPVALSGCSEPITPAFEVVLGIAPVAIASSLSVTDLASMAARTHAPLRHPPLGFYSSTFGYILKVIDQGIGSGSCPHNFKVHVLMELAGRHIEIAQELRKTPCSYHLYLQHYREHAASDVAIVAEYRTRVHRALHSMNMPIQVDSATPGDKIYRLVRDTVDRTLEPMTRDRKALSREIDSPAEVERLERSCGHGPGTDDLQPF